MANIFPGLLHVIIIKWWIIKLLKTLSYCTSSLEINQRNVHCFTPVVQLRIQKVFCIIVRSIIVTHWFVLLWIMEVLIYGSLNGILSYRSVQCCYKPLRVFIIVCTIHARLIAKYRAILNLFLCTFCLFHLLNKNPQNFDLSMLEHIMYY